MQSYDVVVIGGGPAGSSLAYGLRGSGLRVAVMDRAQFPRDKLCAGWVTPAVLNLLDIDLVDYAKSRVLQPISGFRLSQIGQKQVQSHYPGEPVSYGILRSEFDDYLLRRCGADLLLGNPLKALKKSDGGWLINSDITARIVIAAGGHACPVSRLIGAKRGSELAVAAQELEFKLTEQQKAQCPVAGATPELFFTPDLKGYGWVFRKGDYLNVGLGREDKSKLPAHVQDFIRYLKDERKIPQDLPEKLRGHAYLLYPHSLREIHQDNVLLVGDAAGLAYPQSGEGIRPAVESALLAAQVIRDCKGDYRHENLQAYAHLLTARFGDRTGLPTPNRGLPVRLKQWAASRLMQSRWFTQKIVTDRWFLHSHQPMLETHNIAAAQESTVQ